MTSLGNSFFEILSTELKCELTGLQHGRNTPAIDTNLHIQTEKIFQIRDPFLGEDSMEVDSFLCMYLDILKHCKLELEKLDNMTDEFCSSYLEALKPAQNSIFVEEKNGKLTSNSDSNTSNNNNSKKKDENQTEFTNHNKKRRGNLPKASTNLLKKWLFDHLFHPYPTEEEKQSLSLQTGLTLNQISNWFINARRRILQPMLENVRQQQQTAQLPTNNTIEKLSFKK
jgi:hypothetical protein